MFYLRFMRKLLVPSIAVLCGVFIVSLQFSRISEISAQVTSNANKEENLQLLQREEASLELLKRFPNFGFDNIVANWTFLRFLQYFGDGKARIQTGYGLSSKYFEIIVDRDPKFIKPYLFLSTSTSLYAGEAHKAIALMDKGLQSLSPTNDLSSYLVWVYKATDELLFLGDTKAAQKSYIQGAKWAFASDNPSVRRMGAVAARTAQFLARNPDSKRAQANAWLMVLHNTVDEPTRQRALNNIKKLGGQVIVKEDNTLSIDLPPND